MKIGIFGGSFDPIHKGHVEIAKQAIKFLNLDKLIFVPANINPFKNKKPVSSVHRLSMLKIALNDPTWIGALKNVKAIYAITDISNGKLYIGSACGNGGLFGRWSDYINNLTGGNQEFEDIKKINGEDYIKKILNILSLKFLILRPNKNTYWKEKIIGKMFLKLKNLE